MVPKIPLKIGNFKNHLAASLEIHNRTSAKTIQGKGLKHLFVWEQFFKVKKEVYNIKIMVYLNNTMLTHKI